MNRTAESQPILLGVNIDHVATLRQARGTRYPDPVQAAIESEQAGADAITLHLREDRRHIQERDVEMLRDTLLTRMNLEMAVTDEMLAIAEKVRPEDCCLVPERREELTTEGGLDVSGQKARIAEACQRLGGGGVSVYPCSLMPIPHRLQQRLIAVHPVSRYIPGISRTRLSGSAGNASGQESRRRLMSGIQTGLHVNAGHGLNYQNVQRVAALSAIRELNIGHAIIARAVFTGLGEAVREMKRLMIDARRCK